MKDQHRNEVKVGLTVLIGLAVLIGGFTVFKGWSPGSSQYIIHMRFPASAGLQTGDQVYVNGVKAGKIKEVVLEENTVLVDAFIDNEIVLTSDATAKIQMLELMGGKKVEIRKGRNNIPLGNLDVIQGSVDPDIAGALGMVGGLGGKVHEIAANANTLLINTNKVLGDSVFTASMKEIVMNLRDVSRTLKPMVAENRGNVKELSTILVGLTKRVDTLVRIIGPKLDRGLGDATTVLRNADTLLSAINALVNDLKSNKSLVSRALYDSTLSTRVNGLLSKLDTLSNFILEGNFKTRIRLF
jgi:phospholipid/cholesterol/gamma-HCH transport system substrate-binding protein